MGKIDSIIEQLSPSEKIELYEALEGDYFVKDVALKKLGLRIQQAFFQFRDKIDKFNREMDKKIKAEKRAFFRQSVESFVDAGRAEVMASFAKTMDEMIAIPFEVYNIDGPLSKIRKLKNELVDENLTSRFRCTPYERTIVSIARKFADILEQGWTNAYICGLCSKHGFSEDEIKDRDKKYQRMEDALRDGMFAFHDARGEIDFEK